MHRLCRATEDKNEVCFFVYFQIKLNAMQRLRHHTSGTLGLMAPQNLTDRIYLNYLFH
jgi:hypothetical protein